MDIRLARHLGRRYAQAHFSRFAPGDLPAILQELTTNEKAKLVDAIAKRDVSAAGSVLVEAAERVAKDAATAYVQGVDTAGHLTFEQAEELIK